MSEITPELKARVLAEIEAHLRVFGPTNWTELREKYPQVKERTFFRWVKAVRLPPPGDDPSHRQVGEEETAPNLSKATQRARLAAQKNLPAAPSPAYMLRDGAQAEQKIDFLAAIGQVWQDALLSRAFAMKVDDGKEVIRSPQLFDASIKRRIEVIEAALRVMQEIWDLQYQQRFYDEITAIIVEELVGIPDIQERVIKRLVDLNNRRGMTLHADPLA